MPKSVPKTIQTCFERVLGQTFRKIFAQFSMECRVFENFQKKNIFKIPKIPKSVPKSIQTCFRVIFSKKIYARCSMEGRVFENFQNFFFKIPKMPKIVPESIQACFERVLGQIFRKIFLPSVPWSVEFSKIFKKNIFKIPKMPKSVPKSIQTCFEHVLAKIFLKNFMPSVAWRVESSKIFKKNIFKIPKLPKSVPKSIQTCYRVIFSKKIYAQCSMEGRVFENFPIFFSKFQKCPKSFPKVSKRVLNVFWGKLFEKFLPSFPWNV